MTTEMNPSPVTVANPAEQPAKPDVSPAGPAIIIAEKKQDACCETGAKSDASPVAAENCASGEKTGKPAGGSAG